MKKKSYLNKTTTCYYENNDCNYLQTDFGFNETS